MEQGDGKRGGREHEISQRHMHGEFNGVSGYGDNSRATAKVCTGEVVGSVRCV